MPEEFLDKTYAGGGARNQGFSNMGNAFERMHRGFGYNSGYADTAQAEKKYGPPPQKKEQRTSFLSQIPLAKKVVEHVPTAGFVASNPQDIQEGMRVEHQKFGFGTILKIEGSNLNPQATIAFDNNGEKKLVLNYAKLRIV
jgi:DNA helicase-2/ATP-dependent DNA helicase PcrA